MPSTVEDPYVETPAWGDWARSPGESQRPDMWRGLTAAYIPVLGPTGLQLLDVSGRNNHADFSAAKPASDWGFERQGHTLNYGDRSDEYAETGGIGQLGYNDTNECAIVARCRTNTASNGIFEQSSGSTVNTGFMLFMSTATQMIFRTVTGGLQTTQAGGLTLPLSGIFVGTYGINSSRDLYRNGVLLATTSSSLVAFDNTLAGSSALARVGSLFLTAFALDGWLDYCLVFNRHMTAAEVASDWMDPLQMFRPRVAHGRGFVAPVGGTILPQMMNHGLYTGGIS